MNAYVTNIEDETLSNKSFRKVLFTSKNQQLVVMSIEAGDHIGMEKHQHVDQFIRIERGDAIAVTIASGKEKNYLLSDGSSINIPQGVWHDIINIGDTDLKLYTIYSPPNHPKNTNEKYHLSNDYDNGDVGLLAPSALL